jgi:hypothetical protein
VFRQPFVPTSERDVARYEQLLQHFRATVPADGCWIVTHLMFPGVLAARDYPSMILRVGGRRISQRLSRMIFVINNGSIEEGLVVRHTCDNKKCVRPEHLIKGTHLENAQDAVSRNRMARLTGDKNGHVKISDQQVRDVLVTGFAAGRSNAELARQLGVSAAQIRGIRQGRSRNTATGFEAPPKLIRQTARPPGTHNRDRPFTQRFLDEFVASVTRVNSPDPDVVGQCHIFYGGKTGGKGFVARDGYGRTRWEGVYRLAHHVAFRIKHGRWPRKNYDISHLCRVKRCVNPDHLAEVTRKEHTYYAAKRGWLREGHLGQRNNQQLTDDQIRYVKERFCGDPTITTARVAAELGGCVTAACVGDIRRGKTGSRVRVEGFVPTSCAEKTARGQDAGRAKLTEQQALMVRQRVRAERPEDIAAELGTSARQVRAIASGKSWKWLESATADADQSSWHTERAKTKAAEADIIRLFHEGKEQEEIRRLLGFNTRSPITAVLRKHGLRRRGVKKVPMYLPQTPAQIQST